MTRSLVGAAAAGSEVEAAFTEAAAVGFTEAACMPDVSTAAATGAVCVRHIPSRAAQAVPDIQLPVVPVVRVTQSLVVPVADSGLPGGYYPYRGYGAAAAVGAAAAGAAYYGSYYNDRCYDAYGNWICPGQYPY